MADDDELDDDEAEAYHKWIGDHIADQESKFDQATLFIAGGAFTVTSLIAIKDWNWILILAWSSWALCLVSSCSSYRLSRDAGVRVRRLLEKGKRNRSAFASADSDRIERTNTTTFRLLVLGRMTPP